jgi:cellulose synthase/poly-beta-1,6-N-acetylglucosamine synthase-like glycosyltransferase
LELSCITGEVFIFSPVYSELQEDYLALEYFTGTTFITKFLFYVAAAIAFIDFAATLFTIIYQRYIYKKFLRPHYGEYTPTCSVLLPCKGIPKDLENNLGAFLELDYPNYEIVFVTESETDPAVPYIKGVIEGHKNAKHIVAGHATNCAQKNHNVLAAYNSIASSTDVLVFADSDIKPAKYWLQELILPLSDPKVTVTSGFRWLYSSKGNVGEMTHSYVNIFMYVLFNFSCYFGGVGLWGGSMAIRKKDFEELSVPERWGRAAVDDISLSQIVLKNRKKAVVVPHCVTHSDDLIQTVKGTVTWFQRQMMYFKYYLRPLWVIVFPLEIMIMVYLLLLPGAGVLSLSDRWTFFGLGGGAALVFYLGELMTILMYPMLGEMPKFYKFVFFSPFIRLTHVISYLMTFPTNTITWSGIKYYITFRGDVSKVERLHG